MGIIQKFKDYREKSLARKIERHKKLVQNAKAIRDDRALALEFFVDPPARHPVSIAVPILLSRFEFSIENGIHDIREKETAMSGIKHYGQQALPLVREHLQQTTRIAWPIKVFLALSDETQLIDCLLSCLDKGEISLDQAKVDKNYDLICYFVDQKLSKEQSDCLLPFLQDADERVRFATVEALVFQEDESLSPKLEPFLIDESSENTRIRETVIRSFIRSGWQLRDKTRFRTGPLTEGTAITDDYKVIAH